jgi:hypothetical protein
VKLGLQREDFEGARVFVLPNPSGRNANYTHAEMLAAFTALSRYVRRAPGAARAGRKARAGVVG